MKNKCTKCTTCRTKKPQQAFSRSQWIKPPDASRRECLLCQGVCQNHTVPPIVNDTWLTRRTILTVVLFLALCVFGVHYCSTPQVTPVYMFLKSKGVFAGDPAKADFEFSRLRNPNQISNLTERMKYLTAQERLLRIVGTEEEKHSNSTFSHDVHLWSKSEFPSYNTDDVFFLKHPLSLNQRHQLSGLCHMHAPAMAQHYALGHNNHSAPMIDLVQFIKQHFSAEQLQHHIFDDRGGNSVGFLKSIIQPNSTLIDVTVPDRIPVAFKSYGPGLVSGFEVYDDFTNATIHHHYGTHSGDFVGLHAMALVGHRTAENGTLYFLLQNWWKKKQFVEVDTNYLKHSGASVWFIETPQTGVPDDFAVNYANFYELEGVDKEESYLFEKKFI